MVNEITLQQVVLAGNITNIFSNLTLIEEEFISGITKYLKYVANSGQYQEPTPVRGVWNMGKAQSHEVTVECSGFMSDAGGLSQNKTTVQYSQDSTNVHEFIALAGMYKFNAEIKCRSTSRSAVARLCDAITTGLQGNLMTYLADLDYSILPNTIGFPNKIERDEIVKDTQTWTLTINISGIETHWSSIREVNGDVVKNFSFYVNLLNK